MCSVCWRRLPNTGTPGSRYMIQCQTFDATWPSRWSRPYASTRSRSPDVRRTSITAARATCSSACVTSATSNPSATSPSRTSSSVGRPPGAPNTASTKPAAANPRKMPPTTSDGNAVPRYIADSVTRITRSRNTRRSGRTTYGASTRANVVMTATLVEGKIGPSPVRMLTSRPWIVCGSRISWSSSPTPHASTPAIATCSATGTFFRSTSTSATPMTAQMDPSA